MPPSGEGAEVADGASAGSPRPPPGVRLRKALGCIGIILGTGLILTSLFLDALENVELSGIFSAQDLGVLAGFILLCFGLLLYVGSSFHFLQRRHHGPVLRVEGLKEAAGQKAARPPESEGQAAGPATEAPAKAINTPMPEPPRAEPSVCGKMVHRAPTAAIVFTVTEAPATGSSVPAPSAEEAASVASEEGKGKTGEVLAPHPALAGPPSYDYAIAAAPGDTSCRVCGYELVNNACRQCITSAAIQNAYQELSRTQELGASVKEAAALLQRARHALEEKEHIAASDLARSAAHLLQLSLQTYLALRAAAEKAEGERKHLEEVGKDTGKLTSLLSSARSAIVDGSYNEAKDLLDKERNAAAELQRPAAPAPPPEPGAAGNAPAPAAPAPPAHKPL